MSAILRPRDCQRFRTSQCQVLILRVIEAKTVRIIIGTTIGILCPVTESVAIAEGAKYRNTATVLPARAAVHRWIFRPAVVTRYVPVWVRPGWSSPPQLHRGDQGEEEGEQQEFHWGDRGGQLDRGGKGEQGEQQLQEQEGRGV